MSTLNSRGVYQILNTVSGKTYIGSTIKTFAARWQQHITSLRLRQHENKLLQRDWTNDGEGVFRFIILEEMSEPIDIRIQELIFIREVLHSGVELYNVLPGAQKARLLSAEITLRQTEFHASDLDLVVRPDTFVDSDAAELLEVQSANDPVAPRRTVDIITPQRVAAVLATLPVGRRSIRSACIAMSLPTGGSGFTSVQTVYREALTLLEEGATATATQSLLEGATAS